MEKVFGGAVNEPTPWQRRSGWRARKQEIAASTTIFKLACESRHSHCRGSSSADEGGNTRRLLGTARPCRTFRHQRLQSWWTTACTMTTHQHAPATTTAEPHKLRRVKALFEQSRPPISTRRRRQLNSDSTTTSPTRLLRHLLRHRTTQHRPPHQLTHRHRRCLLKKERRACNRARDQVWARRAGKRACMQHQRWVAPADEQKCTWARRPCSQGL